MFDDENTTDGIAKVLTKLHGYIPKATNGQNKSIYHEAGVVGDQLTIERAVNCLLSLSNGFTPDERLEGIHTEIADWYAELKFLSVSWIFIMPNNPFSGNILLILSAV